jgi:hypothetical protein
MNRTLFYSATFAVLAGATACATSSAAGSTTAAAAPAVIDPNEEAAARGRLVRSAEMHYPADSYIVGFGAGSTAEDAESHARVEAAAAISSQIKANLSAIQSESGSGSTHTTSFTVSDAIVQEVQTDAGAFIQAAHELTTLIGKTYQAVAVADRSELDKKYATEAARTTEKLLLAWDRALTASKQSNQSAVLAALCDATANEQALDKIDRERQLVARKSAWTADALAKRHEVEQVRSHLKGARVNIYQPTSVDGIDVSDALVKKLDAAGYDVGLVKQPKCAEGGLLVSVAFAETCGSSMLGQRCEADLSATSARCGQTDTLFDEHSDKVAAMHATDSKIAEKAAIKKLDTRKFVSSVATRVLAALEGGCQR